MTALRKYKHKGRLCFIAAASNSLPTTHVNIVYLGGPPVIPQTEVAALKNELEEVEQ
jgi:hypothetical protein